MPTNLNEKKLFITIAIIALIMQLLPVWWFTTFSASYFFFINIIIQGGALVSPITISAILFTGIISLYSIIAIITPIASLYLIKKSGDKKIYSAKKNIIFLIINIITIISTIILIAINKGIFLIF